MIQAGYAYQLGSVDLRWEDIVLKVQGDCRAVVGQKDTGVQGWQSERVVVELEKRQSCVPDMRLLLCGLYRVLGSQPVATEAWCESVR